MSPVSETVAHRIHLSQDHRALLVLQRQPRPQRKRSQERDEQATTEEAR